MTIIKIVNTPAGEVAYILDEKAGRVMKVLVDDYTGAIADEQRFEGETEPMPSHRPVRRMPAIPQGRPEVAQDDDIVDRPPQKTKPSIVPPGLAGVFKPPGTAGAAEEMRIA